MRAATRAGIAVAHSVFNLLCTAMLLPAGDLLEKLAIRLVPGQQERGNRFRAGRAPARRALAGAAAAAAPLPVKWRSAPCVALNNALRSFTDYTRHARPKHPRRRGALPTTMRTSSAPISFSSAPATMGADESEEATELLKSIGRL